MRERLWGQRMLALYRCGRQGEALAVYRQLRTTLADDLGLDPSAALRRLEHAVLAQDPSLDVSGGDRIGTSPARSDLPVAPVPRQLRMPPRSFIGRTRELAYLDTLVRNDGLHLDADMVCVLSGTAGAGKTALALAWAHRASSRFPDGQLYVNLRGFDPDGAHLDPAEALRSFLEAFGVPGHRIPAGLEGQAALYRSVLAEKRVLVVLDNALDADQVRPLLPGSTGCAVIVTSRDQLTGLVAAEGAAHLKVNVLSLVEAHQMLASRLGPERTSAEPLALDEIVRACGRLPLALAVAAARASTTPSLPLDALAAHLADSRSRLDTLAGDDPTTNVRSVLSWSYDALGSDAAHLFRRLGLHPSNRSLPDRCRQPLRLAGPPRTDGDERACSRQPDHRTHPQPLPASRSAARLRPGTGPPNRLRPGPTCRTVPATGPLSPHRTCSGIDGEPGAETDRHRAAPRRSHRRATARCRASS